MKNEEKDLKKERRIEYIVTVGTLLFIGLLGIFSIRGCENNIVDLNTSANTLPKNNDLELSTVSKKESTKELEAQKVMAKNRENEEARIQAQAKKLADQKNARKLELEAQKVMAENRAKEEARIQAQTKKLADQENARKLELEAKRT